MFFAKSWILLIKFFEMPRSVSKSLFFAALFVEGTLPTHINGPEGRGGWLGPAGRRFDSGVSLAFKNGRWSDPAY